MNNKLIVAEKAPEALPAEYGGSLAVSLARAEVDQQISTARAFPRSIARSVEHILTLATLDETAAAECIYALPRGKDETGGKKIVKGPSIRLAEIVASQWGNCRVGSRVVHVDRFEKYVEAEAVFHDLETNMATTARIRRGIANKYGKLYTEDMIVVTGNAAAAIAKRNAILGGVPRGVWRRAYDAVEQVISGDVKTLVSRRRSAIATMAGEFGITADRIFAALEIGGEEDIDLEQLSILTAMRSSLKNGEASVEELFPKPQSKDPAPKGLAEKLDVIAAGGNGNGEPHDPKTGEILASSNESEKINAGAIVAGFEQHHGGAEALNMQNDPAGEKAGARLKERLDERATTGPTTQDFKGSDGGQLPSEQATPAIDLGTQRLIDDARAKTKDGALKFKYWVARLNQANINKLAPYLEQLRAEANAVDAAKEIA